MLNSSTRGRSPCFLILKKLFSSEEYWYFCSTFHAGTGLRPERSKGPQKFFCNFLREFAPGEKKKSDSFRFIFLDADPFNNLAVIVFLAFNVNSIAFHDIQLQHEVI